MDQEQGQKLKVQDKIAMHNHYLKIFVVVIITLIVGIQVWQTDLSQVFVGFVFSDLLTLFLAMFAVVLSVLFYLKATETANVFYNNTYRFTKDVSEILGRVEAGFGEKLTHLDKGYLGLKSAVERIPLDIGQTEQDIAKKEERLQEILKDKDQIIENLMGKAKLNEKDQEKLLSDLKTKDEMLSETRRELNSLRNKITEENITRHAEEKQSVAPPDYVFISLFRRFMNDFKYDYLVNLLDSINMDDPGEKNLLDIAKHLGNEAWPAMAKEISERDLLKLKRHGLITADDKMLTARGTYYFLEALIRTVSGAQYG